MSSAFSKIRKYFDQDEIYKLLLVALLCGAFLRFYHFDKRWGIGSDDMRDITIARVALGRHELPLIGSFSSAGPFVFGPLYYWYLMISYVIFPFSITAPWLINVLISISLILLGFVIGEKMSGKRLGILLAFLVAFSPQLVYRSTGLSQHSFIAIFSLLLILAFINFWQKRQLKYALYMGLSLGAALSMHFQALNLFIFLPALFFVPKISWQNKIKASLFFVLGFIIPSLPMIVWDSRQGFANTNNLLDYMLIGQYRLYVPNSWKLFLFKYIPVYWSFVVGGYGFMGFVLLALFGTFFAIFLWSLYTKKTKNGNYLLVALGIIFSILLVVNRFYHGERSEGYLLYLMPFILIFSAWSIEQIIVRSRFFGLVFLFVVILMDFMIAGQYTFLSNNHGDVFYQAADNLITKYPNKKFALYDYYWKSSDVSYGFGAILKDKGKADKNGMPIGINCALLSCPRHVFEIEAIGAHQIVDLSNNKEFLEKKTKWGRVDVDAIYDDLMQWEKGSHLKSTFNLSDFIFGKFKTKKV